MILAGFWVEEQGSHEIFESNSSRVGLLFGSPEDGVDNLQIAAEDQERRDVERDEAIDLVFDAHRRIADDDSEDAEQQQDVILTGEDHGGAPARAFRQGRRFALQGGVLVG